jgi:hypothetical protein
MAAHPDPLGDQIGDRFRLSRPAGVHNQCLCHLRFSLLDPFVNPCLIAIRCVTGIVQKLAMGLAVGTLAWRGLGLKLIAAVAAFPVVDLCFGHGTPPDLFVLG